MPVNLVLRVWVTAELVVRDWVHLADIYVGSVRKTKEQEASEGRQPLGTRRGRNITPAENTNYARTPVASTAVTSRDKARLKHSHSA